MHRKDVRAYPACYYELFDELQADMHKWRFDGRVEYGSGYSLVLTQDAPFGGTESGIHYRGRMLHSSKD